jgi:hypothetical protein
MFLFFFVAVVIDSRKIPLSVIFTIHIVQGRVFECHRMKLPLPSDEWHLLGSGLRSGAQLSHPE